MAHELLAARAARIRRIRQRVLAGTVAAFALAWGVVAFDGPMGAETTTTTAQASTTTSAAATTSADDAPSTLSTGQS
jgi:hypothetical protein